MSKDILQNKLEVSEFIFHQRLYQVNNKIINLYFSILICLYVKHTSLFTFTLSNELSVDLTLVWLSH